MLLVVSWRVNHCSGLSPNLASSAGSCPGVKIIPYLPSIITKSILVFLIVSYIIISVEKFLLPFTAGMTIGKTLALSG